MIAAPFLYCHIKISKIPQKILSEMYMNLKDCIKEKWKRKKNKQSGCE